SFVPRVERKACFINTETPVGKRGGKTPQKKSELLFFEEAEFKPTESVVFFWGCDYSPHHNPSQRSY
ncbi:hypothetical protein, partial [Oceanobacillus jeddahense]|uniref:hypothetical protein n=1 Tax=Oceanobacillus jeddahense TaxID=1462527 RepID=UPI0036254093